MCIFFIYIFIQGNIQCIIAISRADLKKKNKKREDKEYREYKEDKERKIEKNGGRK